MTRYAQGHHPASRAALVPFTGANDPRRHCGAPSFGREITSAMNHLASEDDQGQALYTEEDLKKIIADVRAPHSRVIAAREILRARLGTFDKIGRIPQSSDSLERILDRTLGRPVQTIRVQAEPARPAAEIKQEIAALIADDPALSGLVREMSPPALESPIAIATPRVQVPEQKPALPAVARAVQEPAKPQEKPAEDKPEPPDPPEAAKPPERRPPDDISAWM